MAHSNGVNEMQDRKKSKHRASSEKKPETRIREKRMYDTDCQLPRPILRIINGSCQFLSVHRRFVFTWKILHFTHSCFDNTLYIYREREIRIASSFMLKSLRILTTFLHSQTAVNHFKQYVQCIRIQCM